jgi:hypothetical protein
MPTHVESNNIAEVPHMESDYGEIQPGMAFMGECRGCGGGIIFVCCYTAGGHVFGYLDHVDENGEFVNVPEELFREDFPHRLKFRESVEEMKPEFKAS